MPVGGAGRETSTTSQHIRFRKPRTDNPISEQSLDNFRPKHTHPQHINNIKKKNITSLALRRLGCLALGQVSIPEAIRVSDWQNTRVIKDKKQKEPIEILHNNESDAVNWCDSLDYDVSNNRREQTGPARRGRAYAERGLTHGMRSYDARRTLPSQQTSRIDSDSTFGRRPYGSEGEFDEIVLFQSSMLSRGRLDMRDRYREWRLDVDNMSYEELVDLGDRIGHVNTGLGNDAIRRCVMKSKFPIESKCSICLEEYEGDDEMGNLKCGHGYHTNCIKQWLEQKNTCPVCKSAAAL